MATSVRGDRMRRLPLHYAAMEGPVEEVRRLAQDPAAVSAKDADGFTPLHFAALQTRGDVIAVLVAAGAEVDATDKWGNTPLWRAVFNSRGRGDAVLALLAAGADRNRQNSHGISPLALANTIANYDVRQFFEAGH